MQVLAAGCVQTCSVPLPCTAIGATVGVVTVVGDGWAEVGPGGIGATTSGSSEQAQIKSSASKQRGVIR